MSEPSGNLVTPIATNPSGLPRGLELDANDALKVTQSDGSTIAANDYVWDGSAWVEKSGDTAGVEYVNPLPHGVISSYGGAQAFAYNVANNNTVTIYTVPSGKTLWLTSLFLSANQTVAAATSTIIRLYNATPTEIMRWAYLMSIIEASHQFWSFNPPLKLDAGFTLQITSPTANVFAHLSMTGYLL